MRTRAVTPETWAAEFDRRVTDPAQRQWMQGPPGQPGEWQVRDDTGDYYRRNSAECCGCGDGKNGHHADEEGNFTIGYIYASKPHLRR